MQSNNPILTRVEVSSDYAQPMSVQGAIQKSVLLTLIAAVVGIGLFFYSFLTANLSIAYASVRAVFGLKVATKARISPPMAPTIAPA